MSLDDQKHIRRILQLGNPVHRIIDEIGAIDGSSILIQGRSGSGKSLLAFGLAKVLLSSGLSCAYFDIEDSNRWLVNEKTKPERAVSYSNPKMFLLLQAELELAAKNNTKVVVFDCLNKLEFSEQEPSDYSSCVNWIIDFCMAHNMFAIILEHFKVGYPVVTDQLTLSRLGYYGEISHVDVDTLVFKFLKNRNTGTLKELVVGKQELFGISCEKQ